MATMDDWSKVDPELLKKLTKEMTTPTGWKKLYEQHWPAGGNMVKTDGFVLDQAPEAVLPKTIHLSQLKGRSDSADAITYSITNRFAAEYPATFDEPEPEPYKDDPRYGTWG